MQGSGVGVCQRTGLRGRQNVEEAVKESSLSHEFQSPEEYSMSQFAHFPLSIFIVIQPSWADLAPEQ